MAATEVKVATMSYRDAISKVLAEEIERDVDVFLIGEDIGRYQGTFRVTQGMWEKYGSKRVLDTPITECGFTGIAIGAAMAGLRPVVEMMTMSFSILAMDQIINHAAKIHYMTGGQAKCPLVIRGPGGAAKQLSAQHTHCVEGWYAHAPGLKVVAPATAVDAYGMLRTAIRDDNPVIFTENPGLYGIQGEVPEDPEFMIPFGKANILKEGTDVSLIGYSRMTQVNLAAAEELAKDGINAEVVDVRSLSPLDMTTINASVAKTHRAVVVYEDWKFGGFGGEIASRIMEDSFDDLDAPVVRVGGLNVPTPYARNLELECIPDTADVVAAVRKIN
ncbi:MAG: alpha-ketoacid dehydrogenase subunit beta [Armatimonadetes bacterium]|nr:alpha-ketoacid dehydrogenase subunit beta [Armatimonadota bacterium]MBX3109688.1 alpha-ketoacid dehydrogenase subunit beta [Fimbriimonadaceae bacterium]